jgi:hypothetical protein
MDNVMLMLPRKKNHKKCYLENLNVYLRPLTNLQFVKMFYINEQRVKFYRSDMLASSLIGQAGVVSSRQNET